ncbi:Cloroperoxidase [Teratosphaeria nubilosa]|uniref:Cloroperoxidase n=1 Tax=Teratosphaeria nubilosa TaxID=161662 RepID=A0A6G1L2M3_9PEZI|nr:Cloroperoxidase [Teratosphaeria nubilosa]
MKCSSQILLGLAPLVSAFPSALLKKALEDPEIAARAQAIYERQAGADSATAVFEPVPTFNENQLVDVSEGSGNEWVAPSGDDLRGPCPGLNAFANHKFLPHNGYATITQFIDVTNKVVGMGTDLATFLSVLGATVDGSGTAWSIGGTPDASVADPLGAPLGAGNGISGSHNKYESDASPTRPDLYESGNDYMTVASQFQQLIDVSPGGYVTMDTLTQHRSNRFDTQVANNPYFFNGPFTGVLVQPAAYTFIYRFMANHSAEYPTGNLSYSTLQSWFAVSGESGSYTATQGHERIPDNWYRRAFEYPYSNEYFLGDVAAAAALHPKFLDVGGNTGTTNSFTGVDVANFTGGLYNAQTLTEGNNFACFGYQFAAQEKPDVALTTIAKLTDALSPVLSSLSCPQLETIDNDQLMQFPGYQKSTASGITK